MNICRKNVIWITKTFITIHTVFILSIAWIGISFAEDDMKVVKQNIEILLETNSCVRCNLQGANLNRADLVDANLSGSNLKNATFFLANLAGANFQKSDLRKTEFGGSDISSADFRGANIISTSFSGAYKRGATFGEIPQANNSLEGPIIERQLSNTSDVKLKQIVEDRELSLVVQPEIISPRGIPPTILDAPLSKKIKPIPKAILIDK